MICFTKQMMMSSTPQCLRHLLQREKLAYCRSVNAVRAQRGELVCISGAKFTKHLRTIL